MFFADMIAAKAAPTRRSDMSLLRGVGGEGVRKLLFREGLNLSKNSLHCVYLQMIFVLYCLSNSDTIQTEIVGRIVGSQYGGEIVGNVC